MKYVLCKECKGYYVLKKGELFNDFDKCLCGGDLEHIKTPKNTLKLNNSENDGKFGKNRGGYLLCKKCHGYYVLQKGESIHDFVKCRCGGDLEYIQTHREVMDKYLAVEKKDLHEDPHYLNQEGLSLYHAKKYSDAIEMFEQALKIYPEFTEALNNKGNSIIQIIKNKKSLERIKGYKKALSCYNNALEIEPRNMDILNNKGLALAYLGDYENSYKVLEEAVKINPHDLGTNILLKKIRAIIIKNFTTKGYEKLESGNYTESLKYINKVLELKPDDIEALMYKGGILFATRNYGEAIKCFDVVIYIKGDHSIAWYSKGESMERLKLYQEAVECYEKVVEITSKRRGNLPAENISPVLNMDLIADAQEHVNRIKKKVK